MIIALSTFLALTGASYFVGYFLLKKNWLRQDKSKRKSRVGRYKKRRYRRRS